MADAPYTVVARRYRPRQLKDLVGQEHVAGALTNALTSGRIAHAYLFTGARGTGKTSTARILAKCLNCEKGPTPTPCDVCDICLSIADGNDVDTLEIDGASNNKVDEARELRQNVGFRPTRSRFKIYIIDEVHMLSTGAFNALLKTLEEPPSHVKFILATTEIQKIPITILSRCQRFDFAYVRAGKIFDALKAIVKNEGLQADDDALHILARRAAGSMRDSQSLLDQMLAFCEGTLTAAKIHEVLGTASEEKVQDLAELILKKDAKASLDLLQEFADKGLQIGELLDALIEYWRGLMLVLAAGPKFGDLPGTPQFQDKLKAHAGVTNLDTVLAGLDVLTAAKTRARGSLHVNTLLEMTVVRLALLDDMVAVSSLLAGSTAPVRLSSTGTEPAKKNSLSPPVAEPPKTVNVTEVSVAVGFIEKELGPMRFARIKSASEHAIIGPNALAFRFFDTYSSLHDSCRTDGTADAMQAALKKHSGQDWRVVLEVIAAKPSGEVKTAPPPRKNDLMTLPLFAKAAATFNAQLVKVDDGFSPVAIAADETEET